MSKDVLTFDAGDRQMLLLALAELALSRPGFDDALSNRGRLQRARDVRSV
jgi:hypothetical protein